MPFKSLTDFIHALESAGELVRIRERVSPKLEITEIADRVVKSGGKALLFENNGTEFPVLINAFGSDRRMSMALGVGDLDESGKELDRLLQRFRSPRGSLVGKISMLPVLSRVGSWMPKRISGKGKCQEVILKEPDLTRLPVLTCWPADGGPFITLPVVHTVDPQTGIRNVGMYRMQVFGPVLTGMHWHLHKGSARHYELYKKLGKRMPVSVTLGGDPACMYAATAPLPEQVDEYLLAGFLRKKRVELVKCLTNDLEVPADADFVIEGYVDPEEELILEGPFGDHTGFYSLAGYYPKFHVTCITHRRNAVYPATVVGIPPMEDAWIGKATERIFRIPLKMTVAAELDDLHMPAQGVFHNIVLGRIENNYPGQALKVMHALWGAGQMMFNKILILLGGEINLTDYRSVARTISRTVNPARDIHFSLGPVDILDHSSRRFAFGSKMGIDATGKPAVKTDSAGADLPGVRKWIPEVGEIKDLQPGEGISLVILGIRKSRKGLIREAADTLWKSGTLGGTKFVLFVDEGVCRLPSGDIAWIAANHLDPERDCFVIQGPEGKGYPVLFMDATRKTYDADGFEREWPNMIVMDDETIRKVDEIWEKLGIGTRIPSPSLLYKNLVFNIKATFI
ncbi:MAG TPA: menaquinone biosynthesis decarboxylase [Bacteroidales bacterium]|nr:menaquinone biosynthesis decarboxylase [Bacteroidales bacterium]